MKEKKYAIALRLLDESILANPEFPDLYAFRSDTYLGLGNLESALLDAKKVIELNPDSARGYYKIGMIYFKIEEYLQAEEAYKLGLKHDPNDEKCMRAIETIQKKSIKQKIRNAIARGKQAFDRSEFDLAIDYFNDAIEQNPRNSTYYVYRSITYMVLKKYDLSTEDAMKIIQHQPNWPKIDPILQGYVSKEGKVNVMMKKRWFILKEFFIYYYGTDKDLNPKGVILLGDCDIQRKKQKQFKIITPTRIYELKVEDEAERDKWIEVLERIMNKKIKLPEYDEKEDIIFLDKTKTEGKNLASLSEVLSSTVTAPFRWKLRHSQQLAILPDENDRTKEGYMFKTGPSNRGWKKRYFVLEGKEQKIYYFKEKDDSLKSGVSPLGSINLYNAKVELTQEKTGKDFAFTVATLERKYLMSALNEQEMKEWMEVIRSVSEMKKGKVEEEEEEEIMPVTKQTEQATTFLNKDSVEPVENGTIQELQQQEQKQTFLPVMELKPPIDFENSRIIRKPISQSFQPRTNSKIDQNEISSSESRYFRKFGLTPPPSHIKFNPYVDSNQGNQEDEPLLKKKPKESSCCCCII